MNANVLTTALTMSGWQSTCFSSLLAFAFTLYYHLRPDPCCVLTDSHELESEYDFIIVGAGSAGSTVANRLSECCGWNVLLLEAGGVETPLSDVPGLGDLLERTDLDWKYKTEPPRHGKEYCLAMTDYECYWPRGKVVGGSSVLNHMLYIRGNKNDYNDWAHLGNVGWSYRDVLPYFLKSEDNTDPKLLETPYHSSGGFLTVENARYTTPLASAWIKAGRYFGYNNIDVNGENQDGFTIPQGTTRRGTRCSTAKAFIVSVQGERKNLVLSMHSFVTGIGIEREGSGLIARAVSFIKGGRKYVVRARNEIILSAGAIGTPQLLMLSGIGPREHLTDLGIPVLKDLPVGYNLQDHLGSGVLVFDVGRNNVTIKPDEEENPDNLIDYLVNGRGPLTTRSNIEGTAFVYSKYANRSRAHPDIQFEFVPTSIYNGDKPFGYTVYNLRPNLFNGTGYQQLQNRNLFTIIAILLRPKSTGRVLLRSKNPYDHPLIIPNYFASREDVKVLIDGFQMALRLADTPPFKQYDTTVVRYPFPGCQHLQLFSDEYFECAIRHFSRTTWHPTCTCPMGVTSSAVVDPRLRVYGVKHLRVIDGSVMPNITSGNTNAPIIMIGEKGSDLVKEDWRCPNYCHDGSYSCRCNSPVIEERE